MVLNLVCGRLISARIVLTLTDLGDLLSWHSALRFPPLGVGVLAVVAFWVGCCPAEVRVFIPMVELTDVS